MSDRLQVLLKEYETMRAQGLEMTSQVRVILSIGLPSIIFMMIFGWTTKQNEILLALPFVALLVLQLLLFSDNLGLGIAGYNAVITEEINNLIGKNTMLWEKSISANFSAHGATTWGTHIMIYSLIIAAVILGLANSYQAYGVEKFIIFSLVAALYGSFIIFSTLEMIDASKRAYDLAIKELCKNEAS